MMNNGGKVEEEVLWVWGRESESVLGVENKELMMIRFGCLCVILKI